MSYIVFTELGAIILGNLVFIESLDEFVVSDAVSLELL